ncbi:hypothetical protein ASD26_17915 [Streptomyces sp. Root1319]|nr:hypothetical protein ASD26_17915 [Streptomyces sp. Root1319]
MKFTEILASCVGLVRSGELFVGRYLCRSLPFVCRYVCRVGVPGRSPGKARPGLFVLVVFAAGHCR